MLETRLPERVSSYPQESQMRGLLQDVPEVGWRHLSCFAQRTRRGLGLQEGSGTKAAVGSLSWVTPDESMSLPAEPQPLVPPTSWHLDSSYDHNGACLLRS